MNQPDYCNCKREAFSSLNIYGPLSYSSGYHLLFPERVWKNLEIISEFWLLGWLVWSSWFQILAGLDSDLRVKSFLIWCHSFQTLGWLLTLGNQGNADQYLDFLTFITWLTLAQLSTPWLTLAHLDSRRPILDHFDSLWCFNEGCDINPKRTDLGSGFPCGFSQIWPILLTFLYPLLCMLSMMLC